MVVTVIYMTVDLAFCGVPGEADRALEWTSVSFAMVAGVEIVSTSPSI